MDQQTVINILISGVGAGVVWWVNVIWRMLETLQQDISHLHIKLAENYVTKVELNRILDKLDEIQAELRNKE